MHLSHEPASPLVRLAFFALSNRLALSGVAALHVLLVTLPVQGKATSSPWVELVLVASISGACDDFYVHTPGATRKLVLRSNVRVPLFDVIDEARRLFLIVEPRASTALDAY
jgi:hypothetical protein